MTEGSSEKPKGANRSKPAWMNEPNAPPRPDLSFYSKRLNELFSQKNALADERRALQETAKMSKEEVDLKTRCDDLRAQMAEIDAKRKDELALRSNKNEEISELWKRRRQNSEKQRLLQAELGGFASVQEIDAGIAYMRRKMEMTGGKHESEKKLNRRLHQLEEGKAFLAQLQDLSDSQKEEQEREMMLEKEAREIHERIEALNKQYQEKIQAKEQLESNRSRLSAGRAEVYKKTDMLREQIKTISEEIQALKKEREEKTTAWDAWCVTAKTNYYARLEAEYQKKREYEKKERKALKLEGKRARALKRQNPYAVEIKTCATLVQYLIEKGQVLARQEEELAKSIASQNFDPSAAAPEGFVVVTEPVRASVGKGKLSAAKNPNIRHSEEMIKMFDSIDIRPPTLRKFISASLTEIEEKKKYYESHIKEGELELSSDEEVTDNDDSEKVNEVAEGQENDTHEDWNESMEQKLHEDVIEVYANGNDENKNVAVE